MPPYIGKKISDNEINDFSPLQPGMLVSNLLVEWGLDNQSLWCDTFCCIDNEKPPHYI